MYTRALVAFFTQCGQETGRRWKCCWGPMPTPIYRTTALILRFTLLAKSKFLDEFLWTMLLQKHLRVLFEFAFAHAVCEMTSWCRGNKEIIKCLIDFGASVHMKNWQKFVCWQVKYTLQTPLQLALVFAESTTHNHWTLQTHLPHGTGLLHRALVWETKLTRGRLASHVQVADSSETDDIKLWVENCNKEYEARCCY